MRIMVDTNILISAILFPSGQAAKAFEKIIGEHELVIASYCVDELKKVVARKFPSKLSAIDLFLKDLSFDLVYTPDNISSRVVQIRDPKDYPVIYTAILENVDILVTGDHDFFDININHPEILSPADFLSQF